jgi:uncharacterized membrane protein
MNRKTYMTWQAVLMVIVGGAVAAGVIWENWIIAFAAVIGGIIILTILRHNTKEVTVDERNIASAYKAARLTFSLGTIGMGIAALVLITLNRDDLASTPAQIGVVLAFIACGLMIINTVAYTIYNRQISGRE